MSEKLGTYEIKNGGVVLFPLTGEVVIIPKVTLVHYFKNEENKYILEITNKALDSKQQVMAFDSMEFPNLDELALELVSIL